MTVTLTTGGGNLTAKFEYVQPTAKMANILTAAANYLWDAGFGDKGTAEVPILFSSLTNQQKADLIDTHLKQVIMDLARTFSANTAQNTARDAAIADANTNLNL